MKILFDHQKFSLQRFGGISRYFANLNTGLNNTPGITSEICALYSENEYVRDARLPFNNQAGYFLFHGHKKRIIRWNNRFSKLRVQLNNFDVFHPTYYDTYYINALKRPLVITVHDMIHELKPALFPDATEIIAKKKLLINKANAIIAISNHTRNEIISIYPAAEKKISVIHHGYALNNTAADSSLLLPDNYLLYVGERWHYKNFSLFVKAIARILSDDKGLKLICAGGGRFNKIEEALLLKLNISDQCLQIAATDAELQQLYKQARLFIFPSLHEGFGLPLLEAFANNCPVICSNTTSLPEIAGNAALYFNPLDEASIAGTVKKVLYTTGIQQQLIAQGRQRLPLFNLKDCISNTLHLYQSVI